LVFFLFFPSHGRVINEKRHAITLQCFFPPSLIFDRKTENKNESKEQNPKNRSDTLSLSLSLQCARCISIQQQFNSILFRFYSSILLVTSSWDTTANEGNFDKS
jgi:hypothetical protein